MIVFYDGNCPLCMKEMDALKSADKANKLDLVNIHSLRFEQDFPEISKQAAMTKLHAYDNQGQLLLGLDVTVGVWRTVGKHRWLGLLRLPGVKFIADKSYLFFAAHRMKISNLLMPNQCGINQKGKCDSDR